MIEDNFELDLCFKGTSPQFKTVIQQMTGHDHAQISAAQQQQLMEANQALSDRNLGLLSHQAKLAGQNQLLLSGMMQSANPLNLLPATPPPPMASAAPPASPLTQVPPPPPPADIPNWLFRFGMGAIGAVFVASLFFAPNSPLSPFIKNVQQSVFK